MNTHLLICAAYIMEAIALLDLDDVYAAAMSETWRQGQALLRSDNAYDQQHGYALMINAIATTPNGGQVLIDALQQSLAGAAS